MADIPSPPILTLHSVQKTTGEAGTLAQYRAEVSQILLEHASPTWRVTVTPHLYAWLKAGLPVECEEREEEWTVLIWAVEGAYLCIVTWEGYNL